MQERISYHFYAFFDFRVLMTDSGFLGGNLLCHFIFYYLFYSANNIRETIVEACNFIEILHQLDTVDDLLMPANLDISKQMN